MVKVIAENRKAAFNYFLEDCFECGIELLGSEIKSIRANGLTLKDAWCDIENDELIIKQMYIKPYERGMLFEAKKLAEGNRPRKLLVHKQELEALKRGLMREGYTLIPVKAYLKGNRLKVEVALAKGKKLYDKRQVIAERDVKNDIARALKEQRY